MLVNICLKVLLSRLNKVQVSVVKNEHTAKPDRAQETDILECWVQTSEIRENTQLNAEAAETLHSDQPLCSKGLSHRKLIVSCPVDFSEAAHPLISTCK